MPSAPGGPRLLLRRLREIMAEPVGAQDRLDKIVILIAANMVAEVCSLYVMRGDGVLELFATEGLNREAVHLTTMRAGEGLVGLIAATAEPLALSDAQAHPAFSYKPETGEEIYHAFLGVPLLRAGNTLGVLVVQNRTYRVYAEEEIEALQTTAMVLAEMLASGELQALAPVETGTALRRPLHQRGVGPRRRRRPWPRGPARAARRGEEPHRREPGGRARAPRGGDRRGPRLHRRTDRARRRRPSRRAPGGARNLPHVRARPGLAAPHARGGGSGLTAEAAVERVQSDNRARMLRQTDPYLRDRLHDLDDLANRLLHRLVGRDLVAAKRARCPRTPSSSRAPWVRRRSSTTTARACAASCSKKAGRRATSPSSPARSASRRSAKSRTPPRSWSRATPSSSTATTGDVQIRPSAEVEAAYAEKARLRARRQEQYRQLRDVPAVTRDGVADHPAAQCRPARRPAASGRDRRRRHRPLPHRAAVHDRRADAHADRAAGALRGRGRRRRATAR